MIPAVLRHSYHSLKWLNIGPAFDSVSKEVSATRDPTRYGSMFDAGLLSSTYPFPFACHVAVGIRNEAARFATPYEKVWHDEVSW